MTSHAFILSSLTELPFGLPGRVFRSPMPFQGGDSDGQLFKQFQQASIAVVVLLVPDEECVRRTGRDLRQFYAANGIEVIYLPIPDFCVPAMKDLRDAVRAALGSAQQGRNVVVHCKAGVGRTGMFLACMLKSCKGITGGEAIYWVRTYIPDALETHGQEQMALDF